MTSQAACSAAGPSSSGCSAGPNRSPSMKKARRLTSGLTGTACLRTTRRIARSCRASWTARLTSRHGRRCRRARRIVLASPSPAKLSVDTRTLVGVRARYVQPYEDWALAGGVVILDASIERVESGGGEYHVHTKRAADALELTFDVDDVIAA